MDTYFVLNYSHHRKQHLFDWCFVPYSQEYFTDTTAVNIMVGQNWAVSREIHDHPQVARNPFQLFYWRENAYIFPFFTKL